MSKLRKKFNTGNITNIHEVSELGKKKLNPKDLISLTPLNEKQSQFFEAMYTQTPVIFQTGCAGTGKSMLALYAALSEVLEPSSPYDKVVIVRSAVQSRDIGFTPGDESEKAAVYELPYKGIVGEIFKYSGNQYENLKALGHLEFVTTSFMRGVTYNRAIVIYDELQNSNYVELATAITRMGHNSKIVFCGDFRQNDLAGKRGEKSGFEDFKAVVNQMPYGMVKFIDYGIDDVVRSGIAREFIRAEFSQ